MPSKTKKDESPNNANVKSKKNVSPKEEQDVFRQRIRIKVRAYDHKVIDQAVRTIIDNIKKAGAEVKGPVPLPTEIKKYTVNRSTFVHKDSREQFEMRIHKRLIDIYEPTPKVIDQLSNLSLPSGVDVEIKM